MHIMQTILGIKSMHNIENVSLLTISWYYLYHVTQAQNYIKCRNDSRVSAVHMGTARLRKGFVVKPYAQNI